MAEADSNSGGGYQPSFMSVTSWIPNSSSIDCFSESAGVSYLVASCSSGVFRLIRVNPGACCQLPLDAEPPAVWMGDKAWMLRRPKME